MRFLLLLAFVVLGASTLSAQQATIELKNGNSLKGKIIEMHSDAYTDIEITPGQVIRVKAENIQKLTIVHPTISQDPTLEKSISPPKGELVVKVPPRRKGVYNYTAMRLAIGSDEVQFGGFGGQNFTEQRIVMGAGFSTEIGYSFSANWDLGAGFGIDWIRQRQLMPMFVTGRYFFGKSGGGVSNIFLGLSAGATIPLASNNPFGFSRVEDASGGIYMHPTIGIQVPFNNGMKYVIDLGWSFQQAKFSIIEPSRTYDETLNLSRVALRMGLFF